MASKTTGKTGTKPKKTDAKTPDKAIYKAKVVQVALQLAQDLGWDRVTLHDIAQESGYTLGQIYEEFCDKTDILVALGRMIDRRVLDGISLDDSMAARDQLFDILMDRFDVLNDYRDGIIAILQSFRYDPKQAVISMPHLCRSMSWMLEAAGIETGGYKGAIKVAGLTGVYLKVLKTWKTDDSPDLSKTMAELDKNLGRAESVANSIGF